MKIQTHGLVVGVGLAKLFAAGEVVGFSGIGYHVYNTLEGTFLDGCMLSELITGKFA